MTTPSPTSSDSEDNYDPASLQFDETEAALLRSLLDELEPGQREEQPAPYWDFDDEAPPTTAATSGNDNNSAPAPAVNCPLCGDPVLAADGNPLDATMRCSWSDCQGYSNFMHAGCCPADLVCPACKVSMLVPYTGPNSPAPQRVRRAFPVHAQSANWDPSHGVRQVGMLCYAAAAATACRFAGVQTTLLESMHRYAYSNGNENSWADAYRRAFDEAKIFLEASSTSPSVDTILAQVQKTKLDVYNVAIGGIGSPAFPGGMDGRLTYPSSASMTGSALLGLIRANKVVMAGDSVHWVIIYACYGSAQDNIDLIEYYDPSGGQAVTQKWPISYKQYIVVG